MKSCHAGALALVGWYLMIPPRLPNGHPNLGAPLSNWEVEASYESAQQCARRHEWDLEVSTTKKRFLGRAPFLEFEQAAKCVARDDSGLKVK